MLCGRVLGKFVGSLAEGQARPTAGRMSQFSWFRSADASVPVMRINGRQTFRCDTCGGASITDEVETFTTYDDEAIEDEPRSRRGRPPKPWRRLADSRLAELGLTG
jgi:hypothetical protein